MPKKAKLAVQKLTKPQRDEMVKEIHQLRRAISILDAIKSDGVRGKDGKLLPGLTRADWVEKLRRYETALDEGRYYNPNVSEDIFDMTGEIHDDTADEQDPDIFDLD